MFTLEHISKSYKDKQILNDISFDAEEGECIGILGTNGAGKSTLLSCIAARYANNKTISIGYLPQENPLFDELKPVDNIKMWCKFKKNEILEKLEQPPLNTLKITDFLDTPVKNMSGGMKKRLSLATVLINQPKVLLMDEPFAALDLLAKEEILSYMKEFLNNKGIIIATKKLIASTQTINNNKNEKKYESIMLQTLPIFPFIFISLIFKYSFVVKLGL